MTAILITVLASIFGACLASLYWLFNKKRAIEELIEHCDRYVELLNQGMDIQKSKIEIFQELSNNLAKENKLLKDELAKKYGQNTTN